MTATPRTPRSIAEFLAWEAGQARRHEFDGVRPVSRPDVTTAHAAIQRNLAIAIGGRLRGRGCSFFGSTVQLAVGRDAGCIRYADGFVTCGQVPGSATLVRDPVVVFEVLGHNTGFTDRIQKTGEYGATPSIQRYVMLEEGGIGAIVFARDRGGWRGQVVAARDDAGQPAWLRLPEIALDLPLAELYDGLEFETG